jgi:NADH-quinone oxidoreductase subunit L
MTAFYMFRLMFLAFWGKPRYDHHTEEHIHESPKSMTVPLMILAVLSIIGGWIGLPLAFGIHLPIDIYEWLAPVTGSIHAEAAGEASHSLEFLMMFISIAVAVTGIGTAFLMYVRRPELADRMAAAFPRLHQELFRKYYVDEIYDAIIIQPMKQFCLALSWFDLHVIDGIVNGSAWMTIKTAIVSVWIDINIVDLLVNLTAFIVNLFGGLLRKVQTGLVQNYGLISLYAFFLLLAFYLLFYAK